jgi:hypothetical protein
MSRKPNAQNDVGYHGVPMRFSINDLRRRASAVLAALIAVLGCAGDEGGPTERRTLDLVVERGLAAGGQVLRAAETFASDETWVAVEVPPQQRVLSDVQLGKDPVLMLRGCIQCEAKLDGGFSGVLRGGLRTNGGRGTEFEFDLRSSDGWWSHEVDLGGAAGRSVQLWLENDLPDGCSLLLREVTIRHEVAASVPTDLPPTQILLISVDTLRSDAVGALGGSVATPHLDRFAAEAETWVRHYAAASWTKPSHASLLTGFYPDTHRAITLEQAMDPAIPTLAERFQGAGLETAALVFDCTWLSPRWGFGKGFNLYEVSRWRAGRQAHMAAQWVLDHRSEDFFFFLHTFEPHSDFKVLPYEAPGLTRWKLAERFGVHGFGCRGGKCASQFINGLHHREVALEPNDADILRYSYDEGVRYLDSALGNLFDDLRSSGIWDQMLVVVTSDHGEAFGERGEFGHNSLHEEIVRVPLMIKWPGGRNAGEIDSTPRSAVDVAPTLLDFAGLGPVELPGEDLRAPRSESAIFSGTLDQAVITGNVKGIFARKLPARVFDLGIDPGEVTDGTNTVPHRTRVLRKLLQEHRKRSRELFQMYGSPGQTGAVALSERERERLRAFGYLE